MDDRSSSSIQPTSVLIRQVVEAADIVAVKECFQVYMEWLNEDVSFQDYATEFGGLPGKYTAPSGALLLALDEPTGLVLGCIAMRPIQLEAQYLLNRRSSVRYCEIKRLFVYPEARGRQISRSLVREVVKRAEVEGYDEILLDTMAKMQAAVKLYESEGFEKTSPYNSSPLDGVMYCSKRLT